MCEPEGASVLDIATTPLKLLAAVGAAVMAFTVLGVALHVLLAHRELLSSRPGVVAVTLHLADGAQVVVEPCAFQMSEVAAVAKRVGAGS